MKKILISVILLISVMLSVLSFSGCTVVIPDIDLGMGDGGKQPGGPSTDGDPNDDENPEIDGGGIKDELEDSAIDDGGKPDSIHAAVAKGKDIALAALLPEDTEAHSWVSACEGIAAVSDGKVTGIKCGRTEIYAKDAEGNTVCTVTLTVEFPIVNNNGYTFPTVKDKTVHKITSLAEADRIVDEAVAKHVDVVTLDFSPLGSSFDPFTDYRGQYEFGNHVTFKMMKYDNAPQLIYLTINYNTEAATTAMDTKPMYDYTSVKSANSVIRGALLKGEARADDYEGFAINSVTKTFDVYNSEELWWAVEHGYKPVFPMESSKAELFYERAKMILRDIVTDSMTDLEKVVAIYEYLVHAVKYDYDTFYSDETNEESKKNVCYYLEGVFESGKAVCDGKSKAFALLCGMEGISCVRDFGDKGPSTVGHAWNYVELDEKWYMVDTTKGDVSFASDTGVGKVYGKSIETVDYIGLLVSTSFYEGTYYYSRIWEDISSKDYGELTEEVFSLKLGGGEYDFTVDSVEEMNELISVLVSSELAEDYFLAIVFDAETYGYDANIFSALDAALIEAGISSPRSYYKVFESGVNGVDVMYVTLHGLKAS